MNKYEFLARLEAALSALEPEERKEALRYYEEYFEDNTDAAQTLGTPESIAADLLASYGIHPASTPNPDKKNELSPGRLIGGILLALLAFLLGCIAFGTACATVAIAVAGCVLLSFSTAVAVTVFGVSLITLGLFGLSLGGAIKSAYGAIRFFKTCKGGDNA